MAASLADAIMGSPPAPGQPLANFESVIDKIHKLTSYNLRRTIPLKKLEPVNWGHSLPELASKELETHVTSKTLRYLPDKPRFVFVATDIVFGVDWVYSKDRAGDYEAGYKEAGLDSVKIAYATAASACFPHVFAPLDP